MSGSGPLIGFSLHTPTTVSEMAWDAVAACAIREAEQKREREEPTER
jgi:hypothetical protein